MNTASLPGVVSPAWLLEHYQEPDVAILDASWYLPSDNRDCRREFERAHIPGAAFFDIDTLSDSTTDLPHMLPAPEQFSAAMRELGIDDSHRIVVYDTAGLFSAPRAWWMFRVFGHQDVAVLDGGLPAWREAGGIVTSDAEPPPSRRGDFTANRPDTRLLRSLEEVRAALTSGDEQVLDARSGPRFAGEQPEPRPGLRSGHMPGARNLPFQQVLNTDRGTLKSEEQIRAGLESAGIDPGKPVITSCGSGVTACVLALALDRVGASAAVYDGSWAEWGARKDTPVEP